MQAVQPQTFSLLNANAFGWCLVRILILSRALHTGIAHWHRLLLNSKIMALRNSVGQLNRLLALQALGSSSALSNSRMFASASVNGVPVEVSCAVMLQLGI